MNAKLREVFDNPEMPTDSEWEHPGWYVRHRCKDLLEFISHFLAREGDCVVYKSPSRQIREVAGATTTYRVSHMIKAMDEGVEVEAFKHMRITPECGRTRCVHPDHLVIRTQRPQG